MSDIDREAMVEQNQALVHYVINKHHYTPPDGMTYDDLAQEGMIGLVEASRTFDPSFGVTFATYAYRCIWNELAKVYRRHQRRVPEVSYDAPVPVEDLEYLDFRDTLVLADYSAYDIPDLLDLKTRLQNLSADERRLVALRLLGRTQCEVAAALGTSQAQVSRILQRVRQKLVS